MCLSLIGQNLYSSDLDQYNPQSTRCREHINLVLHNLHWLPVIYRIHFKILLTTYKSFSTHLPDPSGLQTQPLLLPPGPSSGPGATGPFQLQHPLSGTLCSTTSDRRTPYLKQVVQQLTPSLLSCPSLFMTPHSSSACTFICPVSLCKASLSTLKSAI